MRDASHGGHRATAVEGTTVRGQAQQAVSDAQGNVRIQFFGGGGPGGGMWAAARFINSARSR
ncbi:MAG: hypothetical protein U0470_13115 [Anaerolineae bacterium]